MRKANMLTISTFFLLSSLPLLAAPIPPEIKSTVAFVYVPDAKGQLQPNGTGFFVSVPTKDPNSSYIYFATAKHVLQKKDKAGNKQWRQSFTLRLNRKDGKHESLRCPIVVSGKKQTVFMHTDPNVDIAIVPVRPDLKTFDLKTIPASWLTTKQDFQELNICEGHEVFFTGLFLPYPGYKKNHPIVRFGRVALVTDEKIEWEKDHPPLDLYVIECTSFGGNSGSPVFFYLGQDRKLGSLNISAPVLKLAGVMKGNFGEASLLRGTNTAKIPYHVRLNSGIAAVIPAYQLHEILFGKELKERRGF